MASLNQILDSMNEEQPDNEVFVIYDGYPIVEQYNDEVYASIDDRVISGLAVQKSVAGESSSQYVEFRMPRMSDGIDLLTKRIEIVYEIKDGVGGVTQPVNVSYSDKTIKLGWAIPPAAVNKAGTILVGVTAIGTENEKPYVWKTTPTEYKVNAGININSNIPEPDNGWYEQFVGDMDLYVGESRKLLKDMQESTVGGAAAIEALENIRIGADGTEYATPGDAVRGQVGALSEEIDDIQNFVENNKNIFDGVYHNIAFYGGIGSEGTIFTNNTVVSAIVKIKPLSTIFISKQDSDRFRVALTEQEPCVGMTVNRIVRIDNTQKKQSPLDDDMFYYSFDSNENENYMIIYLSATNEKPNVQIEYNYFTKYNPKMISNNCISNLNYAQYYGASGDVYSVHDNAPYNVNEKIAYDDTDALQLLFDNCDGIAILEHCKKYRITKSINVDLTKVHKIVGNGATIVTHSNSENAGQFSALNVIGTLTGCADPSEGGLIAFDEGFPNIENLKITSSYKNRGTALSIKGSFGLMITNCSFFYMKNGIEFSGYNRNVIISNNHIYGFIENGIVFNSDCNFHQINIVGNHISYCKKCIFSNDATIFNIQITGNDIETSIMDYIGETTLHFLVSQNGMIECLEITGNTLEDHKSTNYLIKLENNLYYTKFCHVTISGNSIGNVANNVFYINKCGGLSIDNNIIKNFDKYAFAIYGNLEGVSISNNELNSSGGGFIKTLAKCDFKNVSISNNRMIGLCSQNAIDIDVYQVSYSHICNNSLRIKSLDNYDVTKPMIYIKTNVSKYTFIKENIAYSEVESTNGTIQVIGANNTCIIDNNIFENIS